jgi:lipopolysaccharide transport system ATP-binding protein
MSDIVIKVESLSKQYRLGQVGTGTLRRDFQRWYSLIRGNGDPTLKIGQENILSSRNLTPDLSDFVWALRDINFEVKQGEVLGIIGKNGAGKSTLLKILSQVTSPTIGEVKVKGRIASLLEVGTGFHPELTGRENIFLNGAILGMKKNEIRTKFDEIVDFSGIDKYIDTPVKRYSSGMYVRLAFAVAAHLEPEILVVDEVLAVGDAEFQKKAMGKMHEVSQNNGRTVLIVSHNMQSISTLTSKSILLSNGCLKEHGVTGFVIQKYLADNSERNYYENNNLHEEIPTITRVYCKTTHSGNTQGQGESIEFSFEINNPVPLRSAAISYQIVNSLNIPVIHILNLSEEQNFCCAKGRYIVKSIIPILRLYPDRYKLIVHFADRITKRKFETLQDIVPFEVKVFNGVRDYYWGDRNAIYLEDSKWQVNYYED